MFRCTLISEPLARIMSPVLPVMVLSKMEAEERNTWMAGHAKSPPYICELQVPELLEIALLAR